MDNLKQISRRITGALFAAQSFVSAGNIAMGSVMTIVAVALSGREAWAGVPTSLMMLASAAAAYFSGVLWGRIGRRKGLALGLSLGAVGLVVIFVSIQINSFWLLVLGAMGVGVARSSIQLARFIAADVNPPDQRGRAISYVVLGGTVGAVLGPLLANPANELGMQMGFAEWTGPAAVGAILFGFGALVAYMGLNPEPGEVAKQIDALYPEKQETLGRSRPLAEILQQPVVLVAMSAIIISQMVMVMVMGITSLHMKVLMHELGAISGVFSAHMMGMFAFSIFTGQLADRWGRVPVILSGIGILMVSFVLAPLFPTALMLGISLYLLGLGWNLCFVGGSALLSDQLSTGERTRTQGFNDLFVGLAAATGSLVAGWIFAGWGYGALNVIAAGLTLIPLALLGWWKLGTKQSSSNSA